MPSKSLNKVILLGNLTRDPELKYTPNGTAIATFSVATNRNWTTSEGQQKEEVQYHRIVAWQKLAELCGKILTKGKKVYLEGRLTYRNYTTKDGQQKTAAEIILDDFIVFNGGKKGTETFQEEQKNETSSNESSEKNQPEEKNLETSSEEDYINQSSSSNASASDKNKEEIINPDDIPF